MENALAALGKEELEELIKKGEGVRVACHFCSREYEVPLEDLKRLLESLKKSH